MIHKVLSIQTKEFNDYSANCLEKMNEFIRGIDVIDIKMNTVVAVTGNFFTKYLVIYREDFPKR